jgi:hypothetical protein
MSNNLSRRDFLKLAGATSAGLALSACGLKATELPTATFVLPTTTPTPTLTPRPTNTSTPTPAVWVENMVGKDGSLVPHPDPAAPAPDPEKDGLPDGLDISNLTYEVKFKDLYLGKTRSVTVWAKDGKTGDLVLIAHYDKQLSAWRWMRPPQRDIGEIIGYGKGIAWDETQPMNMFTDPNHIQAADDHFNIFHPIGSFMPYAFEYQGKSLLELYPNSVPPHIKDKRGTALKRVLEADQTLLMGLGWAPSDSAIFPEDEMSSGNISDETRNKILHYEERIIREVLDAVRTIRVNGGRSPIFYLTNEILYGGGPYHSGGAGYYDRSATWTNAKDPHTLVHGRNVFKDAWLKCRDIAQELGLKPDDYRVGFGDFNMNQYHEKTKLLASELARARNEIVQETGLKPDEVQMDVLMQCRARTGRLRRDFDEEPPTEQQLSEAVRILFKSANQVHFIEAGQTGMTPEQSLEYFSMLDRVAMNEEVTSCTYWKPFLSQGQPDNDANGPSVESPLLFDRHSNPTQNYEILTDQMIGFAKSKGLICEGTC